MAVAALVYIIEKQVIIMCEYTHMHVFHGGHQLIPTVTAATVSYTTEVLD